MFFPNIVSNNICALILYGYSYNMNFDNDSCL